MESWNYSITYIQCSDQLKKMACLFAGLGHLQPLLMATTNANYLLDRFCMERCCSSEYTSRIVTSLIFMEILATLIVAPIGVGIGIKKCSGSQAQNLVNHTKEEERYRGYISITIQFIILVGYLQILYAFTTGGKKGHMEWFYLSLILQYFVICLIAGGIGFWDVGHALWYLMAIPLGPVMVFFYQLYIHSWIGNNGPRDAEYLIVEYQIWLAICMSCMATIFWAVGHVIPHIPTLALTQEATLNKLPNPDNTNTKITKTHIITAKEYTYSTKSATAEISSNSTQAVTVTIKYIKVTLNGATPPDITVHPGKTLKVDNSEKTATVTAEVATNSVTIKIGNPEEILGTRTVTGNSVKIEKIYLVLEHTASINLSGGSGTSVKVQGYAYIANCGFYIKSITGATGWTENWYGEKCLYAAYYKTNTDPALLKLYVLGNTLTTRYYGHAGSSTWKKITADKFNEKLDGLVTTGSFSLTASDGEEASDPQHNTSFSMVLFDTSKWKPWPPWNWTLSPTCLPLLMQGLSVGAVGSIFPNLIPKTLTCPKTTRTLSVMNMFLVPVPHIINLALADNGWPRWSPGNKWDENKGWPLSWLLYIFYILAFLFAIFNVHYPEWRLSTFLRNNTWFVFLMTLFTNVLNEVFNAISRGGIMTQKSANKKLNHPLLWNKMACLLSLSYLPFWMTTTPMIKSYVNSLDPFLCDKDRDHWPTARYGKWRE